MSFFSREIFVVEEQRAEEHCLYDIFIAAKISLVFISGHNSQGLFKNFVKSAYTKCGA